MTLDDLDRLTGGKLGAHDVPCPICGPYRRAFANQRRPVLRIWYIEPTFATFHCARCGEKGHARDHSAPSPDPAMLERARLEAAERERLASGDQLRKARWLWSYRRPIEGSLAERYLRGARGYAGPLPSTLGFLPARGKHGGAMIAVFGLAHEPEPGVLAIDDAAVRGGHITRLSPNGTKAGTNSDKIMIGRCTGSPIALAPVDDACGLTIAEGIEDTLSAHSATGLGAWAAGSASRLPALADVVPDYVECVSILVDDDPAGRRHSAELAARLDARGIETRQVELTAMRRRAA
jgi:hypothetical protein